MTDVIIAEAVIIAASMALGAVLEYVCHSMHFDHRKGRH